MNPDEYRLYLVQLLSCSGERESFNLFTLKNPNVISPCIQNGTLQ